MPRRPLTSNVCALAALVAAALAWNCSGVPTAPGPQTTASAVPGASAMGESGTTAAPDTAPSDEPASASTTRGLAPKDYLTGIPQGGGGRSHFCIMLAGDPANKAFPERCGTPFEAGCEVSVPLRVGEVSPGSAFSSADIEADLTTVRSSFVGCFLESDAPAGDLRFELTLSARKATEFGPINDGFGCADNVRSSGKQPGSPELDACLRAVLRNTVVHLPRAGKTSFTVTIGAPPAPVGSKP